MIFYKLGSVLLFIFVILLLFGSFWHVWIWTDYFSDHTGLAILLAILSAVAFWFIVKKINTMIRRSTLENILKDMNSHINPEVALQKYKACILDFKRIESPLRTIYRFILNSPLKIWNHHLAEEISYDEHSNHWKLLREAGTWELFTGPHVPGDVPIGECRKCKHQIYEDDLEELKDKDIENTCIECGATDLNLRKK